MAGLIERLAYSSLGAFAIYQILLVLHAPAALAIGVSALIMAAAFKSEAKKQ